MVDKDNTYFLVEDTTSTLYKVPIEELKGFLMVKTDTNEYVQNLIDKIDEVSSYILELSAKFVDEHYSTEQLSSEFEMISETDYLKMDKRILDENDIQNFILDTGIILEQTVDETYDKEDTDSNNIFDKTVGKDAEKYG